MSDPKILPEVAEEIVEPPTTPTGYEQAAEEDAA